MKQQIAIYIAIQLTLWFGFWWCDLAYTYSDLKDYLQTLLTASSMVFTIMGLWIAFLYPTALQRLINPDKEEKVDLPESVNEIKRLESLVGSVIRSAMVVVMIMSLFFAKMVFWQSGFYLENITGIKSLVISFVCILSILQIESIAHVIWSNVHFLNDLHARKEKVEGDQDLLN